MAKKKKRDRSGSAAGGSEWRRLSGLKGVLVTVTPRVHAMIRAAAAQTTGGAVSMSAWCADVLEAAALCELRKLGIDPDSLEWEGKPPAGAPTPGERGCYGKSAGGRPCARQAIVWDAGGIGWCRNHKWAARWEQTPGESGIPQE